MYRWLNTGLLINKLLLTIIVCTPGLTNGDDYLPTIFWDPKSPALDRQYWSKVVNVKIFQTLTFLCPTDYVHITRRNSPNPRTDSYYNLYVRELSPNDTNLDYDTICDPKKSKYIYSCNQSRDAIEFSSKIFKRFPTNTQQAHANDPSFQYGKDYIFFSTSNGRQETLRTNSTKCTMVFRIHFCASGEECPISECATYGREEVCKPKPKPKPELKTTAPRDVLITANTTSSLTISWEEPSTTDTNITYYSICYRESSTQDCRTKIVEPHVQSAILENLNSSTEYRIRVRAHTCNGPGEYSNEISQKTSKIDKKEIPPVTDPSVTDTPVPDTTDKPTQGSVIASRPRQVAGTPVSSSSLEVTWKEPDIINGDVIYYSICCREREGQECSTKLVESNKRSAILRDLNSSTTYGIRIRAHTCNGPGSYSEEIRKTTMVPSPVSSARGKCSESTIDAVSLAIGMIIGLSVALVLAIIVWFATKKRRKPADKPMLQEVTNRGYRQSISNVDAVNNKLNGQPSKSALELDYIG